MSELTVDKTSFPDFLSSNYFENILQKYFHQPHLKVHSIKVGPCGAAGDAFASTMFCVHVITSQSYKSDFKRNSYIVKMLPTLQLARDKLGSGSYNVQKKEMEIFQKIFPEFGKILKSINENTNVFPKAIAVDRVRDVLLLEDLAVKRFVMADRKVGLDENHMRLSLHKLARFHAASMVLLEENPELLENFNVGMFSTNTSAFNEFFLSHMDALTAEVSTWDDYKSYGEKLELMKGKLMEKSFRAFDNDPGDFQVLVHGDLWVNNIMFKYDEHGSPADAILVKCLKVFFSTFYS